MTGYRRTFWRRTTASAINGAKAGIIAGIVYGLVLAPLTYFTLLADKSAITSTISQNMPPNTNSPFTPDQLYQIALVTGPVVVVIVGVTIGLILGAVYGRLFERVPGRTAVIKGITFGIVFWILVSVLGGLGNLQYGLETYGTELGIGLATSLLFGWLMGYFFGRFTRTSTPMDSQL